MAGFSAALPLKPKRLQQFPCCVRAQRGIITSAVGSLPPLDRSQYVGWVVPPQSGRPEADTRRTTWMLQSRPA